MAVLQKTEQEQSVLLFGLVWHCVLSYEFIKDEDLEFLFANVD